MKRKSIIISMKLDYIQTPVCYCLEARLSAVHVNLHTSNYITKIADTDSSAAQCNQIF